MTVHKHCLLLINIMYVYVILCKLLVINLQSIHGSSHGSTLRIYCHLFVHLFLCFDDINASLPQSLWQALSRCPLSIQTVSLFNYLANFNGLKKKKNKVWLSASFPAHQHQTKNHHFHWNDHCHLTFQRTAEKAVWCQHPAVNMF